MRGAKEISYSLSSTAYLINCLNDSSLWCISFSEKRSGRGGNWDKPLVETRPMDCSSSYRKVGHLWKVLFTTVANGDKGYKTFQCPQRSQFFFFFSNSMNYPHFNPFFHNNSLQSIFYIFNLNYSLSIQFLISYYVIIQLSIYLIHLLHFSFSIFSYFNSIL